MEIITINVGHNDSERRAGIYAEKNNLQYPVIFDTKSKITREYRVTGVPTVFVADTEGTIIFRNYYVPNQEEINEMLRW